jgi:hypothetical protein
MEETQSESTESKSTGSSRRRNQNRKRSASTEGVGSAGAVAAAAVANGSAATSNGTANGGSDTMSYEVLDFQPASYLLAPLGNDSGNNNNSASPRLLTGASSSRSRSHTSAPQSQTRLYGLEIPPVPPRNCCAACHGTRNQELRDDTVLLCDGHNCGLEFHLQCCVPTVTEIPDQEWYCFDCSATGSTAVLQQYLEQNDDIKAEFGTWQEYRESLWDIDFQEEGSASPTGPATVNVTVQRRPKSELDRAFQSHELAMVPEKKGDRSRSRTPSKKARSLKSGGDAIMAHPSVVSVPDCLAHATVLSHMDTTGEQHRHPQHFLGRPVRLYNPDGNTYHTGRIVDWRENTSWPRHTNNNSNNSYSNNKSISVPTMKEYSVRFTAGMDDRKTAYQHWIVLEEHGTCDIYVIVYDRVFYV